MHERTNSIYLLLAKVIALIELPLGSVTLFGLTVCPFFFLSQKPSNVFVFVLMSAIISTVLGYGMLKRREWARHLLVFFSGYVVLTKILLSVRLLEFKGEIITSVPSWLKNSISLVYHVGLIILLENARFKQAFNKNSQDEIQAL